MKYEPLPDRLDRLSEFVTESGCQIWIGAYSRNGYGITSNRSRKTLRVHRVSWELAFGAIPSGMQVLHKCDVRCCINPNHLFLGTNQDNMADKKAKGRSARGEKNGQAKLTASQVLAIRADTRSHHVVAKEYGVDFTNISLIRRRKKWAHLPDAAQEPAP